MDNIGIWDQAGAGWGGENGLGADATSFFLAPFDVTALFFFLYVGDLLL